METLEDYLPQIQLLTLQNYNNTIIAYAAYVRFGKKAIADYCREKIGKEVRVIVKDDDPINEEFSLDSCSPYGLSKITQERFAKLYREQYGMKIYCVRAFNHTGVGQSDRFVIPSWCRQVALLSAKKKNGNIIVGNIDVYRDFSDVRDVVRAYRMILESEKSKTIYNVGSGKATKLKDILDYIVSLSSCKISIEIDPSLVRNGENAKIYSCNELIRKDLCWYPQYDISDTVKDIYEYYYNMFT